MPFFGSLSEFIASLSPRRQHPADRQLQDRQPSHHSDLSSTRHSLSPTPAGPRRLDIDRHQPPLGSDLEGNYHSPRHIRISPHSARDQDIDVNQQVCGFQFYDDAFTRLHLFAWWLVSHTPPYLPGLSI